MVYNDDHVFCSQIVWVRNSGSHGDGLSLFHNVWGFLLMDEDSDAREVGSSEVWSGTQAGMTQPEHAPMCHMTLLQHGTWFPGGCVPGSNTL